MKTYLHTNKVNSGRVVVSTVCTIGGMLEAACPYETMVFEAHPDQDEVLSYTSVDSKGYYSLADSEQGHQEMIKAWS